MKKKGLSLSVQKAKHLDMFGDKVKARAQAQLAEIPVIPGSDGPVNSIEEVEEFAEKYDYPIIIKASLGGGGRGMRIVRASEELRESYESCEIRSKSSLW